MQPVTIPITGSVDPALLAGLITLATNITAVGAATAASAEKSEKAKGAYETFFSTSVRGAAALTAAHQAIASFLGSVNAAADEITALATEQAELDRTSHRLGLNFDDMAAAAGRFTDETQAMALGTRLAAQGLNLTQTQSESLMRAIGARSIRDNLSMQEAIDQTTSAIIRGRRQGLEPYGRAVGELSGSAHSANERLRAIVRTAGDVERASDTAADQVARLRDQFDDSKRVVAASFVREIGAIQAITTESETAEGKAEELNESYREFGETLATTTARGVIGLRLLGAAANVVLGGITGPLSALAAGARVEGVGLDAARQRIAAMRAVWQSEANGGRAAQAEDEFARLTNQAAALDRRVETREHERDARRARSAARAREDASGAMTFTGDEATEVLSSGPQGRARPPGAPGAAAAARQQAQKERAAADAIRAEEAATTLEAIAERHRLTLRAIGEVTNRDHRAHLTEQAVEARRAGEERIVYEADLATRRVEIERSVFERRERFADDEREGQKQAAQDALGIADMESENLRRRLEAHETFTGRLTELYDQQQDHVGRVADVTSKAFSAMGTAIGDHILAVVSGRETLAQALEGMLADTLSAIAKEAAIKGSLYAAEGLGRLALWDVPGALQSFGASAAFFTVAGLAGAASAAVAPSPAAASPAAAGTGGAGGMLPDRSSSSEGAAPMVQHVYYAPVIGERSATDAEVDTRLDRYRDAGRARRRREAA